MIDSLVDEVKELKPVMMTGTLSIPPPTESVKEWPVIGEKVYGFWQNASVNLEQTIIKYQDQLTEFGSKLAKGILSAGGGVIQMMAALIIAGILLVIGGIGEVTPEIFQETCRCKG